MRFFNEGLVGVALIGSHEDGNQPDSPSCPIIGFVPEPVRTRRVKRHLSVTGESWSNGGAFPLDDHVYDAACAEESGRWDIQVCVRRPPCTSLTWRTNTERCFGLCNRWSSQFLSRIYKYDTVVLQKQVLEVISVWFHLLFYLGWMFSLVFWKKTLKIQYNISPSSLTFMFLIPREDVAGS